MNNTDYRIKLARIWNSSSDRGEALRRAREEIDPSLTLSKMMSKIRYMQSKGVPLCDLTPSRHVDWARVNDAIDCC
jgi:hypothetical protein